MIGSLIGRPITAKILQVVGIGFALVVFGLVVYAMRLDYLRAGWKHKAEVITIELKDVRDQTKAVADAVGMQSGNPTLKWTKGNKGEPVLQQVHLLGEAKRAWQNTAVDQSQRIHEIGQEQERLKKLNAELRKQAEKLIAQRNRALRDLEQMELTPGERGNCEAQLREAERALDILYKEGM